MSYITSSSGSSSSIYSGMPSPAVYHPDGHFPFPSASSSFANQFPASLRKLLVDNEDVLRELIIAWIEQRFDMKPLDVPPVFFPGDVSIYEEEEQ